MAARQSTQGDILLIRPFSLLFLCSLGVALTCAVFTFLVFGRYTPRAHVPAFIVEPVAPAHPDLQLMLQLGDARQLTIQPGAEILVRCSGCANSAAAKIVSVAAPSAACNTNCSSLANPAPPPLSILISISAADLHESQIFSSLTSGSKIEAEIPGQSRRLLDWLFEKPGL